MAIIRCLQHHQPMLPHRLGHAANTSACHLQAW
jgi:hypothetical protein